MAFARSLDHLDYSDLLVTDTTVDRPLSAPNTNSNNNTSAIDASRDSTSSESEHTSTTSNHNTTSATTTPNNKIKINNSNNSAITAKLTTSAGITVTYTAPALPTTILCTSTRPESSASIPLTWSTIEEEDDDDDIDGESPSSNDVLAFDSGDDLTSSQDKSGHIWTNLDNSGQVDDNAGVSDSESENDDQEEATYRSFLAPYGQVLLDPDLDLEPQIITEIEPSPDYDHIYNSKGELIKQNIDDDDDDDVESNEDWTSLDKSGQIWTNMDKSGQDDNNDDDNYPSSWDDDDDQEDLGEQQLIDLEERCQSNEPFTINIIKKNSSVEEPWSDIGQSVNSSFEFWKTTNKLKAVMSQPKLFDTKYQHNNRYASDSNIQDAVDMTEPGLRKIPKVSNYSTTTSSEMTSTTPNQQDHDHLIINNQEEGTENNFMKSSQHQSTNYHSNNNNNNRHSSSNEHIYCSIEDGIHVATTTDADNVYETVDAVPDDSGFFSYISTTTPAPCAAASSAARRESALATAASPASSYHHHHVAAASGQSHFSALPQAVTCIPINQCPSSTTSSEYDETNLTPLTTSMLCTRVTVNGKLWLNPYGTPCSTTTTNSANPSSDIQNTNSVLLLLNTKRQIYLLAYFFYNLCYLLLTFSPYFPIFPLVEMTQLQV